jgi:predicted pyridoxine 5'-phosphate oxidase superfamily flavin-nucleotide-binding protein
VSRTPENAVGDGAKVTGVLTADMKRVVEEQRLGFVAAVCPDGTPNLSPKGTTAVWDDARCARVTSSRFAPAGPVRRQRSSRRTIDRPPASGTIA